MPVQPDPATCTLLLFVATPAEEQALQAAAAARHLTFQKLKHPKLREDYHWLGTIGRENVIAIRPAREHGQIVMGALGRLGSAARAIHFKQATGAQGIVQLGMAFGIDTHRQNVGDVLVSASLVPYDTRDIKPGRRSILRKLFGQRDYVTDYSRASRQPARPELIELFFREQRRGGHSFAVHVGAILSGAARIGSQAFRDELVAGVPAGDEPIVGGEMEGVGLLAASTNPDDPIWCVVKGITDFADEAREAMAQANRTQACRNAAEFVLAALLNDAET